MHHSFLSRIFTGIVCIFLFQTLLSTTALGAESEEEKIRRRIQELEQKKKAIEDGIQKKADASTPGAQQLNEVITKWENLLDNCNQQKNERCPEVMFQLGQLYYQQDRDVYAQRREQFEKAMDEYDKKGGQQPVNPIPDYSRSLNIYRRLIKEYSSFNRNDEANYQVGNILLLAGNLDSAKAAFLNIIEKSPNSSRASYAYARIAIDFEWQDRNYSKALEYLAKVKKDQVNAELWENAHYTRAECNYNMGAFDIASQLFFEYVEKCDAGEYKKQDLRNEALEYMATAFSDMPQGAVEAVKFFKRMGSRPFEAQVIYTVGMKNATHGQFEDAINAIGTALKEFPYYKDAPLARNSLIECLVVKRRFEEANRERESLVDDYWQGSAWYSKNAKEKAVIDQARIYIDKALANICRYYHALANQKKDKTLYQKALKRYDEYFSKFSENKWVIFEFRSNIAEIYHNLGDFEKASSNYWFVATEDLSKYPSYVIDVDSNLYDNAKDFEKAKIDARSKGAMAISQEDAGYNAIIDLDNLRKKKVAQNSMDDVQAYSLPETQRMLQYIELFRARFPKSENASDLLYLAGNMHYGSKAYDKAIQSFKYICESYPSAKITPKAYRMLAKSYAASGEIDMAMNQYKALLGKTDPNSQEYAEIVDLAAAAIFTKAENFKKAGNLDGAAQAFKSVVTEFPKSTVGDRGWYEAGVCYEEAKNYDLAAQTFSEMAVTFDKSKLREDAFRRAADNYKKADKWEMAAAVYAKGADLIKKADFAIPSLSSASDCYQKTSNFQMAGRMFQLVFEKYIEDARAPQCLYNAGLIFERGKLYDDAVRVYMTIGEKYPKSEFAEDAAFAVGDCLDKMNKYPEAALAYSEFAKKFENRNKQIEALFRAGDDFVKSDALKDAETAYLSGTTLFDKFQNKSDQQLKSIAARGYCSLGDLYSKEFSAFKLTGANDKEVKNKIKDKKDLLEKTLKVYAKAIETGIVEWVFKGVYMTGISYVQMSDDYASQTLFGSLEQKIGQRYAILSSMEKYYIEAQKKFGWIIDKAMEQNVKNEYVDQGVDQYMRMAYMKGRLLEDIADIFKNSPIPKDMSADEQDAYKQLLEENELKARDMAWPKYEEAIKSAADIGIAHSQWLDSLKTRLTDINPQSDALSITIQPKIDKILGGKATADSLRAIQQSPEKQQSIILKEEQKAAPSSTQAPSAKQPEEAADDSGKKKKKKRF